MCILDELETKTVLSLVRNRGFCKKNYYTTYDINYMSYHMSLSAVLTKDSKHIDF